MQSARVGSRGLDQAQLGPIGALAQEFGIERDGRGGRELGGQFG